MVPASTSNPVDEQPTLTADTPFVAADDTFHPSPDNDPYWTETTWWSFNVPERKLGCWLHSEFNTVRGTVTWRVYVWDPSGAYPEDLAYYRKLTEVPQPDPNPDLRDITVPGGGFSVRMVRPLREYRVDYTDPDAGLEIHLTFDAVHDPRRYTPGEPPFMQYTHLDQLCHVTGHMVLSGERIEIDSYSVRDRSWAPRGAPRPAGPKTPRPEKTSRVTHPGGPTWREIEREKGRGRIQYIFGHAGPDTGFLAFVRPAEGDARGWSPLNHGWLLRDDRFERLDRAASGMKNYRDPQTGWSGYMQVELTDLTGRTMSVEGHSVSHICEHHGGSTALMRWDFDNGQIGWGEDQDIWHPTHFARMRDALQAVR